MEHDRKPLVVLGPGEPYRRALDAHVLAALGLDRAAHERAIDAELDAAARRAGRIAVLMGLAILAATVALLIWGTP